MSREQVITRPVHGWGPILEMIEDGVDPSGPEIAARLRSHKNVPHQVRQLIADILEDKRPRKPGPKPKKYGTDHLDRCVIALDIHLLRKKYAAENVHGSLARAYRKMSRETGLSESTLKRYHRNFLKYVTD